MTEIRLYGRLGRIFGRSHMREVRTPAEGIRALCHTLPGFQAYLVKHSEPGYRILVGYEDRDAMGLLAPAARTIRIVPVTAGAGRGAWMVIAGAVAITFAWVTGGASLTLAQAWAAGGMQLAGYAAGVIGVALVLMGVSMLLAPKIKDEREKKPSYAFDGAVNSADQGAAVGVIYGRLIVGSQTISAALVAEQVAV